MRANAPRARRDPRRRPDSGTEATRRRFFGIKPPPIRQNEYNCPIESGEWRVFDGGSKRARGRPSRCVRPAHAAFELHVRARHLPSRHRPLRGSQHARRRPRRILLLQRTGGGGGVHHLRPSRAPRSGGAPVRLLDLRVCQPAAGQHQQRALRPGGAPQRPREKPDRVVGAGPGGDGVHGVHVLGSPASPAARGGSSRRRAPATAPTGSARVRAVRGGASAVPERRACAQPRDRRGRPVHDA